MKGVKRTGGQTAPQHNKTLLIVGIAMAVVVPAVILLASKMPKGTQDSLPGEPIQESIMQQTEDKIGPNLSELLSGLKGSGWEINFTQGNPIGGYENWIGVLEGTPIYVQSFGLGENLGLLMLYVQIKEDINSNNENMGIIRDFASVVDHESEDWVESEFNYVIRNRDKDYSAEESFNGFTTLLEYKQMENFDYLQFWVDYRDASPGLELRTRF